MLGDEPGWADIACYTPVWMCRGNIADSDSILGPLTALGAWEERVTGLGHGERHEIEADEALAIARDSQSVAEADVQENSEGLAAGESVAVSPDDYGKDAVQGELLRLTDRDVAVRRNDERAGEVVVHFPRAGYRLEAI